MYTPVNPSFYYIIVGCKGCSLHGLVFVMKTVHFQMKVCDIVLILAQSIVCEYKEQSLKEPHSEYFLQK